MKEERLNYYKEWIEENEEIVVDSSIFKELVDEIERLNNIINELEKWLDKKLDAITSRLTCEPDIRDIKPLNSNRDLLIALKDKLKELKEGK